MGYPKKLLADDESIVYELRPHWRALVAPALVFLLSIGVGSYLLAKFATGDEVWVPAVRWVIGLAMFFALVAWVLRPFAFWWTTRYVFTDHRIIVRTGLIARKGRDMPLSRVNDVSFEHGIIERFLNCGTLIVESAGTQGQLVIRSVPNIEQIQRDIYRLHDEDDERRRRRSDSTDVGGTRSAGSAGSAGGAGGAGGAADSAGGPEVRGGHAARPWPGQD